MFTGLVTDKGAIAAISDQQDLRRIRIHSSYDPDVIRAGRPYGSSSVATAAGVLTVGLAVQGRNSAEG